MTEHNNGFIIQQKDIDSLKFVFYADIVLDILALVTCGISAWIYANFLLSVILSLLGLLVSAIGIYLSVLQARIWRRVLAHRHWPWLRRR